MPILLIFAIIFLGLLIHQDIQNAQRRENASPPPAAEKKQETPAGCTRVATLSKSGFWSERLECPEKPKP